MNYSLHSLILSAERDNTPRGQLETRVRGRNLRDRYTESGQTLQGSFAAVSKHNFASEYSCESTRRDLQSQCFFHNLLNVCANLLNFADVLPNVAEFALNVDKMVADFLRIFPPEFAELR